MSFSPDLSKQNQPVLIFNENKVVHCTSQKHLGIFLDSKVLDFRPSKLSLMNI